MECKDCVHCNVCCDWKNICNQMSAFSSVEMEVCKDFKDKSKIIELPCNAGDDVFEITDRNTISVFRIRFIEISICNNIFLHTDIIEGFIYSGEVFRESDIGKTVFLTREEAEKALEERIK